MKIPITQALLLTLLGTPLPGVAGEAPSDARAYTIDELVSPYRPDGAEPTEVGHQFWFVDKSFLDGRTLKMSVVAPGKATHAPHRHGEDEFFFVLEGRAEFIFEDESRVVEPYTSLYCPPNQLHGIRNVGDTELKYLVIKKYDLEAEK